MSLGFRVQIIKPYISNLYEFICTGANTSLCTLDAPSYALLQVLHSKLGTFMQIENQIKLAQGISR